MIATVIKDLNSIDKVKNFVSLNLNFDGDVTVYSGVYVVDGKSILGVFSLNLCNSVNVCIDGSEGDIQTLLDKYEEKGI